nr:hypothetical protein [uncultured Duganella sp.]
MNAKLTAMIAGLCMSASVFAQTQPATTAGTSNTGTPTAGQSTSNSGEQNATTMQNNSNMQNTATPRPARADKQDKKAQQAKIGANCAQGKTDGHASAPTHHGTTTAEGCDTKTMQR